MEIQVDHKNAHKYVRTQHFDKFLIERKDVWHEVVVRHPGFEKHHRRSNMVKAISDAVDGNPLYLVNYKPGKTEDRFLVKNCSAALKMLFAKQLQIPFEFGRILSLTIYLNVAPYRSGQTSPENVLRKVVDNCLKQMRDGIVDMSRFAERKEFEHITFHMDNSGVFSDICKFVYENDEYYRKIYGFDFSHNEMSRVKALNVFGKLHLKSLDLRNNQINDVKGICKDLANIRGNQLYLAGNPITTKKAYPQCLKNILDNFKHLDSMQMEFMSDEYNPLNVDPSLRCGYLIQATNKMDVHKYRKSEDWHVVKIADSEHAFTKQDIFSSIFRSADPDLPPLYPCYYKYDNGAHAFLLRQCFVQLEYMIFQGKILDSSERPFPATIYMDSFKFQPGQIEPHKCLVQALTTRCSQTEGLVDLDSFQDAKGLENLGINMNSNNFMKTLFNLLHTVLVNRCVTLRLASNNLTQLCVLALLPVVQTLENLDLSHNLLPGLEAIKNAKMLQLKSIALAGNPLCRAYGNRATYKAVVRDRFRGLQMLDNMDVNSEDNDTVSQNYLSDALLHPFVEEFVGRYFETFDSTSRIALKGLYHLHARFTMHSCYSRVCTPQRLHPYIMLNGNILKKGTSNVTRGPDAIIEHLLQIPKVTHDTSSFTVDTVGMPNGSVHITVTGCFVDEPNALSSQLIMAFARTFILVPVSASKGIFEGSQQFVITNEFWNVFNPTKKQLESFRSEVFKQQPHKTDLTESDLKFQLVALQEMTGLKFLWCATFLEQAKWNLGLALKMFTVSYTSESIPIDAFIETK